jgi:hypothetical protein
MPGKTVIKEEKEKKNCPKVIHPEQLTGPLWKCCLPVLGYWKLRSFPEEQSHSLPQAMEPAV